MTTQRWLTVAAILTALLILLAAAAAWRSAFPAPLTGDQIRARTAEQMHRIEVRAAELEANASR